MVDDADLIQLGHEVLRALSAAETERLIELSDPDVPWHSFFAQLTAGGVYRGHAGLERYMGDLAEAFELVRAEVDDALTVGNVAVLVGRIHFIGRESGVEAAPPAGWVFSFRRGKLLRFQAFREPERALEALASPD